MSRFDFSGVMFKASTWLGIVSGMCSAAIVTFAAWPDRLQAITPDWALLAMAVGSVASVLNPLATSYQQKRFKADDTDKAGA